MRKQILESLPILTLIFIYFAYCNLHYYYSEFHIEIYNYVSNSEILTSFLPEIVIFTSFFSLTLVQILIDEKPIKALDTPISKKEEQNPASKFKQFISSPLTILLIAYLIKILFDLTLTHFFSYKYYELRIYNLICGLLFPILIYLAYSKKKIDYDIDKVFLPKYSFALSVLLIFYIGGQIGQFRKAEADELKEAKSHVRMNLNYKNGKISTDQNLVFVGQTQSTIFLYNKKDSSTQVYSKTAIDSIKIKYVP